MSYSLNSKELKKLNNSIAAANKRTAEYNFNDVTDISIVSWLANYDPSGKSEFVLICGVLSAHYYNLSASI